MNTLINQPELLKATGHKTKSSLEKCLRAQKVRFLYGKNGEIFTTLDALNAAMGLQSQTQEPESIEFF